MNAVELQEASGQPVQSNAADGSKGEKESEQTPASTLEGLQESGKRPFALAHSGCCYDCAAVCGCVTT